MMMTVKYILLFLLLLIASCASYRRETAAQALQQAPGSSSQEAVAQALGKAATVLTSLHGNFPSPDVFNSILSSSDVRNEAVRAEVTALYRGEYEGLSRLSPAEQAEGLNDLALGLLDRASPPPF